MLTLFISQHFFQGMNSIPVQYYRSLDQMVEDFAFHNSRDAVRQLAAETDKFSLPNRPEQRLKEDLWALGAHDIPNELTVSETVKRVAEIAREIEKDWNKFVLKRNEELEEFRKTDFNIDDN